MSRSTEPRTTAQALAGAADGPVLSAVGVGKRFGDLVVLDDVGLDVGPAEAVGIVGPNGAGKTTLLDILSGAQRPSSGVVTFLGHDVTGWPAARRCRHGIGRSHQVPRPFTGMTVYENALTAALSGTLHSARVARRNAVDVLDRCDMLHLANRQAASLTLLQRKRLELARALATEPRVLLLDEIAGGLTDAETDELVETIRQVRQEGVAIVWIEHVIHALLRVVERLVCLTGGRVIADGASNEVMSDPRVIQAYLGSSA